MDPVGNDVPGQARHRCRVLPPLAEGLFRLPHRRTLKLQMHVVDRGIWPVDGICSDALPVATVIGAVAAAVVEVDAAEEGPIVAGTVAITDDHHLLVMAAEREHPLVQHDLATRPVDGEGEPPVRARLRIHQAGVGVPEQPVHPRAATCCRAECLDDRGSVVGEELVGIAPPPDELHRVAVARRGQRFRQRVEVHTPVHQRANGVALGPRAEAGGSVAALELGEEPVRDGALTRLSEAEGRSHQREELLGVRRPDHCRTDGVRGPGGRCDSRPVDVVHLAQRDHRDPARVVVREIEEHLRVVLSVVPDEHPSHVRRLLGELLEAGQLAPPASSEEPPGDEAVAGRQERARRIAVSREQIRDRPAHEYREVGHVVHRRVVQIGRERPDEAGHGQHRTSISKSGRAQGPKSSE
jgi:hypothetical protein